MMAKVMRMVFVTLAANLMVCGGAWAGPTWICSLSSAVAVDEDGTVGPPDLGGRERPSFFRVDCDKKELTLLAPKSRRGEVTKIDTIHEFDGQWMLSGVEHGRSWSLIIREEGRLTMSLISDGVAWSIFGHALPEGELEPTPTPASESTAESTAEPPSEEGEEADEDQGEDEDEADDEAAESPSESAPK